MRWIVIWLAVCSAIAPAAVGCGGEDVVMMPPPEAICDVQAAHQTGGARSSLITRITNSSGADVTGIKSYASSETSPDIVIGDTIVPNIAWSAVSVVTGPSNGQCSVEAAGTYETNWAPSIDPQSPYKIFFTRIWPATAP